MSAKAQFHLLENFPDFSEEEMKDRARLFFEEMKSRRTVRDFSDQVPPREIIEDAIRTAGRAPSGANKQPWHFAVIADPATKTRLRVAAEEEERAFYGGRAGDGWLADLAHLGTDAHKPFLETAPYLIVVFRENYRTDEDTGQKQTNYYVHESVGIACGFLLTALHHAGLATLTHTPSPMNFLNRLCGRDRNEKAVMIIVAGYPGKDCQVPVIDKKPLDDISSWI